MSQRKKLLLNWVYYRPVGHAVEALKIAKGYVAANKDIDVYLLLNAATPIELAKACPWIKKTYSVSLKEIWKYGSKAPSLKGIPKIWDYVITDNRVTRFKKNWDEADLFKSHNILDPMLRARAGKGYIELSDTKRVLLPYAYNQKVTLAIPRAARTFAQKYKHAGPTICIMLGGSAGDTQSPTVEIWLMICKALFVAIPNLKIYFTGVTKSIHGRTHTIDFLLSDVNYLVKNLPNAEAAYNIGLWNQLALIAKCDIFLSPHTGFGFLPQLVGTPWLELGNCPWPAYVFNGMPFYSVLPLCGSYPSRGETKKGCGKLLAANKKALCMSDSLLVKKIPEIVRGAKLLLDKRFSYKKALKLHLKKIAKPPYQKKEFFFFDGIRSL